MGCPIVIKLLSQTITHKTDVGGVKLNLTSEEAIKKAYKEIESSVTKLKGREHFQGVTVQKMIKLEGNYELIIGSSQDEQFGPYVLFGTGGQLVEVFQDRALALPPLTSVLARRMMEQTKIYHALKGVRGRKPVDLKQLENILVQFSKLIVEQPWIKECDINPLLASEEELIALDARIILHPENITPEEIPQPAIRPYPNQYVSSWELKDQTKVDIRPIVPEDEELIRRFHKDLSEETIRQRYLKVLHYDTLTLHERLIRICFNDYDRDIALVVTLKNGSKEEIIGVARLTKIIGTSEGVFAIIIKDQWQNKGLGTKLLQEMITIATNEKLEVLSAQMLPENEHMQKMCKKMGFIMHPDKDTGYIVAHLML
jgi:acetyltransferase